MVFISQLKRIQKELKKNTNWRHANHHFVMIQKIIYSKMIQTPNIFNYNLTSTKLHLN